MKSLLLSAASLFCSAQSITIPAGSPNDQYFTGGVGAWPVPLVSPNAFLRYGTNFKYDIPLANGIYTVSVVMAEPNKTAAGQRIFTVSANGQTSGPIDLFRITGGINQPYTLPMLALVGAGFLRLQFTASAGNAVVSSITATPLPSIAQWTACVGAPSSMSSCMGLEFFSIIKADGSVVLRYAVPAPGVPDPSIWTAVK